MKLTNPPLVSCRRCGAVYAASFALSGGYDKPELAGEAIEKARAAVPDVGERFFLGAQCQTQLSSWDEINATTFAPCGDFYWRFVEVP